MTAAALCLVYNHNYEGNVDRLNDMYTSRFSAVRHLMPFAHRSDATILPVMASSWNFQSHVAQNWQALISLDVEWFIFAGDDLVLHPDLDQDNLVERFALAGSQAFIKRLRSLSEVSFGWYFWDRGVQPWLRATGVEWQNILPSAKSAAASFVRHGLPTSSAMTFKNMCPAEGMEGRGVSRRALLRGARALLLHGGIDPGYPLAMGYSDIFILHRSVLRDFACYAGVMGAMGVFAEVAIPTALCLATESIVREVDLHDAGREIWTFAEQRELVVQHGGELNALLQSWPPDLLWLHPVKFSEWS